ncbi:hypothetical protein GGS26DRAFT_603456 [Hypomontagnella submonticulosa]|nr:hypothetical protein GGS26DRAFT_603456 [Hypomontagnella submonticulosa]
MEDDFRYRVNYSENVAPKYPAASQEGLEVVPNDSPLYPLPPTNAFTPVYPVDTEKWTPTSNTRGWADFPASAVTAPEDRGDETAEKRRILGLTVPIFWALVVFVVIILAGGIGGGIGGGLTKLNNTVASDTTNVSQATTTTSSSSSLAGTPTSSGQTGGSSTVPLSGPTPSDSGTYTPYAVDGKPIPLQEGLEGQQFKQQCYTNYIASGHSQTHDILRIFMPTLENCMMACAEYNAAYHANLQDGTGVGGGYCVSVTIAKINAGFCYLKNGTTTNDTQGRPDLYSSAVLLTKLDTNTT